MLLVVCFFVCHAYKAVSMPLLFLLKYSSATIMFLINVIIDNLVVFNVVMEKSIVEKNKIPPF